MVEPDDFVSVIEDDEPSVAASAPRWTIAVIDDDRPCTTAPASRSTTTSSTGSAWRSCPPSPRPRGASSCAGTPDIAVVLLDVVMETEEAGLDLVSFIRNELKNETVRVILRTGQPGQAPERRVIVDYDINDYKAKTELTADKLFTTLTAALRSFQPAPAHDGNPAGAGDHHRGGLDAVRLQVDAALGRGRPDPDGIAPQRGMRGVWCCATSGMAAKASPCSPAPAATAASRAPATRLPWSRRFVR
jgi:hypothetical protein